MIRCHVGLRWGIAICMLLCFFVGVAVFGGPVFSADLDKKSFENLPFTEITKQAFELRLQGVQGLFQLSLLLLGALWALVIAKKDEAKLLLEDVQEIIMFCCSNGLLLLSIWAYMKYIEFVRYAFVLAAKTKPPSDQAFATVTDPNMRGILDIFSPAFDDQYQAQLRFLSSSVIAVAITLVSAHRLKPQT